MLSHHGYLERFREQGEMDNSGINSRIFWRLVPPRLQLFAPEIRTGRACDRNAKHSNSSHPWLYMRNNLGNKN